MQKIVKSIAFVAMFALASTASAQNEIVVNSEADAINALQNDSTRPAFVPVNEITISTGDVVVGKKDGKDVVAHAGDTIKFLGYSYRYKSGNIVKIPRKRVAPPTVTEIVRDEALKAKLDTVEVNTQTAAALVNDQQDMIWYETSYGHRIPSSVQKENGLYFSLGANYQALEGANAFGAQGGIGYKFDRWLFAEGSFGYTKNVFYKNSERAGEDYGAWYAQLMGGLKYDFGRRRNWSVYGAGGWRYTWQSTQTKEMVDVYGNKTFMQTSGKTGAPVWGAGISYRFSDTGWRVSLGYIGSVKERVQQNEGTDNQVAHGAELKLEVPFSTLFKSMSTK